jgi:cyclopropane-fatty-acyl-phospholipid synthase
MHLMKGQAIIEELLAMAGIKINGGNPWDMQLNDGRIFDVIFKNPILGLGESYIAGWWDCICLDQFFDRLLSSPLQEMIQKDKRFLYSILFARLRASFSRMVNLQSKSRAFQVGEQHYDISNTLYQHMLDKRMNYSCGYWKESENLDAAQEAKLELICQKLELKPGMRVLDIGCGWGGFSKYAAEKYGVSVVGVTVSIQQQQYAQEICRGLPVEIRLQDYRDLTEKFDRVCSVGMFEHVGPKNYATYMQVAHACLEDNGLFLLHTIGGNVSMASPNSWIHKYIFPNGILPSIPQIGQSIEKLFVMEDWHNFGADYDKTLMAWHKNFGHYWVQFKQQHGAHFQRIWNYYLLSCAGAFRARDVQLWQVVLSKKGIKGGYCSIR